MAAVAMYASWAAEASGITDSILFALSAIDASGKAQAYINIGGTPSTGESVGPPFVSQAIRKVFSATGNTDFVLRALPALIRRHTYLLERFARRTVDAEQKPVTTRILPAEFSIATGSETQAPSADAIAYLLLDARSLEACATAAKQHEAANIYRTESELLAKELLDLWNKEEGRFMGGPSEPRTLAPLWVSALAMLGEQGRRSQSALTSRHIFDRTMPCPSFSAIGGPQTGATTRLVYQYLALRALNDAGGFADAARMATKALTVMEAHAGPSKNLYSEYIPDTGMPVGSASAIEGGCMAIAGLLEFVIGIQVDGPARTVSWHIQRNDRHGARRLRFGNNVVSLICEKRELGTAPTLAIDAEQAFTLVTSVDGKQHTKRIKSGRTVWRVE
jgi:hypothetical protein